MISLLGQEQIVGQPDNTTMPTSLLSIRGGASSKPHTSAPSDVDKADKSDKSLLPPSRHFDLTAYEQRDLLWTAKPDDTPDHLFACHNVSHSETKGDFCKISLLKFIVPRLRAK
ncbi:hypothetical protein BaRGS_00014250 [Batillaria attramentaria]|uniref:Uncharacterized protein n=1 Tax=Batillaria attramentaria TaxID=370345 RepID=A0ABD0L5A2_9CAEN